MRETFAITVAFLALLPLSRAEVTDSAACSAISNFARQRGYGGKDKPIPKVQFTCSLPEKPQIDFVIATVPNPLETHLALFLDRQLESIQAAATASGFQFQAAKIPWDTDLLRDQQYPKIRQEQEREREKAEKEPGVLLFRAKYGSGQRDLAILMVPETPTSGIDADVFCDAITIALPASPQKTIQLLGPSFSGSLPSLWDILRGTGGCAAVSDANFVVTSGSIIGLIAPPGNLKTLDSFHTTSRNIQELWNALISELESQDSRPKIAILSESDTRYSLDDPRKTSKDDLGKRAPLDFPGPGGEPVLRMTYPREISRLRNAFSDQELKVAAGAQPETSFRNLLTFRIVETGPAIDTTPVFATDQTPLSQNAVLESISHTLQNERVNLVAVLSTDPFDALFIARYLRDSTPNVRVLTLDSDLLWVRAAEDFPFTGTLAATSYPLMAQSQQWAEDLRDDPPKTMHRTLFPSRVAEGIYNAMIVILRNLKDPETDLLDYFSPFPKSDPRSAPPIWLTIVSRGQYWPLAVINPKQDNPTLFPSPATGYNTAIDAIDVPLPRLWRSLFVGLTGALLWHFFMVWGAKFSRRRQFTEYGIWPDEKRGLARLCYLLISSFALLALYGVFIAPLISVYQTYPKADLLFWSICATVFFCIFGFSALIGALLELPKLLSAGVERRDRWHFGILAITFAYLVFLYWAAMRLFFLRPDPDNHQVFFFAYRSLHFSSNVSPVAPILFILGGFFWWGRVHLARLAILHDRPVRLPPIGWDQEQAAIKPVQERLEGFIRDPLPLHWRTLGASGLIIAIWCFLAGALSTFEYKPYDLLVLISLGILYALLFLTWYRVLLIWSELHLLLEYLERHPIRFAFNTLPRQQSWSAIFRIAPTKRSYWPEIFTRDALPMRFKDRRETRPAFLVETPDALTEPAKRYNQRLQDVLTRATQGERVPRLEHCRLSNTLAELHVALLEDLKPYWSSGQFAVERRLVDTSASNQSAPDPEADAHQIGEAIVAVQFVSYVRDVLLQMRNLTYFVLGGFVLSIAALNCYPFQSPTTITVFISLMFVIFACGIVVVMAQAERNATLSRITKTQAGTLSPSFYGRLVGYLGFPALTVLSSQFPSWGRFLFSWVQPMLEALK